MFDAVTTTVADRPLRSRAVRVLIVDDQVAVARTIGRWLEREGMSCDIASSAPEAFRLAIDGSYDLVLTDVHMPGGSGLDLARRLKAADSAIQVVIMTGSTTVETAIQALRLDADDYLLKPFETGELVHAARRAAEHRRLLVENRDYRRTLEERVREQARRLESLYLSGIHSLATALEAKDPSTRGHSERVARYAVALGERVGGIDVEVLHIGASLHDIGKIGIRTDTLAKEGALTADEWSHVRRHPAIGEEILRPMLQDRRVLEIVRHHHERWDGAGYPDGLVGEDIPRLARIVAVADAFDAMTTLRPYRHTCSAERAAAEVEAQAGRQFDPVIAGLAGDALVGSLQAAS